MTIRAPDERDLWVGRRVADTELLSATRPRFSATQRMIAMGVWTPSGGRCWAVETYPDDHDRPGKRSAAAERLADHRQR
jgi:hypothetical protein